MLVFVPVLLPLRWVKLYTNRTDFQENIPVYESSGKVQTLMKCPGVNDLRPGPSVRVCSGQKITRRQGKAAGSC